MNIYTLGMIEKDNKLLLLLRKNTPFFSGYYGLPGGKLEPHESVADGLIRELHEELGIIILPDKMQFAHCLSTKNENGEEFIALAFKISGWKGELVNREPDKHEKLAWFDVESLAYQMLNKLVPRHYQVIMKVQQGVLYSENGW